MTISTKSVFCSLSVIVLADPTKQLSLALDAAYCYLLQTIDRVWETPGVDHDSKVLRQWLIRNIHSIMMDILTPIADLLVQLPFASSAGPPCPTEPAQSGEPRHPVRLATPRPRDGGGAQEDVRPVPAQVHR